MDWIRDNKPLAVILGIIIAASLALGYLLFDSWSKYAETKESYLGMSANVAQLKGRRLAPTDENLKEKQALVDEFGTQVNQLHKALLILQPPVEPIKNIEFQAKLKDKVAEARKDAGLARMVLPADFAFGFEEYTSNLPSENASAELSGYLDAMVALVKLFMSCNVESVDLLDRSKLPVEGGATKAATPPQRNARPGMQQQPVMAGPAVLEKREISVILTLDQGALQNLTTKLATPAEMPYFTSLRLLRIENQRQDGPPRDAGGAGSANAAPPPPAPAPAATPAPAAAGAAGAKPAAGAAPVVEEIRPPDPAPPDATPLIGMEKLKVRMDIDLVKFLDPTTAAAPQGAPGAQR